MKLSEECKKEQTIPVFFLELNKENDDQLQKNTQEAEQFR